MNHKMALKAITFLAITTALMVSASAQIRQTSTHRSKLASAKAQKPAYVPEVRGHSDSFIVEGEITAISKRNVIVMAMDGKVYDIKLDNQTTALESGEIFSIATMADISIKPEDLRIYDHIEIVAERAGRASLARIITRIEQGSNRVAKR